MTIVKSAGRTLYTKISKSQKSGPLQCTNNQRSQVSHKVCKTRRLHLFVLRYSTVLILIRKITAIL
jgi:hypothetical protein